ncbi:basic leucine zipper transcriptional factor ATF-like 2 isoform X2 [Saccopteryx leptura]|uniref:basic leucine zipper transcriptional factor ATF-like 2 isoform X2 n=1 Tax=Saccopteryx leptura TaxID=249018 RepID=UPI00339C1F24
MHLCGDEGLQTRMDPEECHRQLKKKQKNRASAQRSRQKHTDKADALHQHESLEKRNRALWKEIHGLKAELDWWSQALSMHEHQCLMDCASCLAPLPPGCWGQAKPPLDPSSHRQHGCQEHPGLFQTPVSSPSAQQLSPDPQPCGSLGLLSPLSSLSLDTTTITAPPAQLSPSPAQSVSPSGSSLVRPSSNLKALLTRSSAQPAPQQALGPEHLPRGKLVSSPDSPSAALGLASLQDREHQPAPQQALGPEHLPRGKLVSSPDSPSAALGLASLQDREHQPAFLAADQQGLGVGLSPHPLLAFPLLSSAQVHF